MEKDYCFEVTLKIGVCIIANNIKDAREQLTNAVKDYVADTEIKIKKSESKLLAIDNRIDSEASCIKCGKSGEFPNGICSKCADERGR